MHIGRGARCKCGQVFEVSEVRETVEQHHASAEPPVTSAGTAVPSSAQPPSPRQERRRALNLGQWSIGGITLLGVAAILAFPAHTNRSITEFEVMRNTSFAFSPPHSPWSVGTYTIDWPRVTVELLLAGAAGFLAFALAGLVGRSRSRAAWPLAGVSAATFVGAAVVGVYAYKAADGRVACLSNLKGLALACRTYAEEHEGMLPATLETLVSGPDSSHYRVNPQMLRCPLARNRSTPSYELAASGRLADLSANAVLIREREPRHGGQAFAAYANTHVGVLTESVTASSAGTSKSSGATVTPSNSAAPGQSPSAIQSDRAHKSPAGTNGSVAPKAPRPADPRDESDDRVSFSPCKTMSVLRLADGKNVLGLPQSKAQPAAPGNEFCVVECRLDVSRWPKESIFFCEGKEGVRIDSTAIVLETADGNRINAQYGAGAHTIDGDEWRFHGPLASVALTLDRNAKVGDKPAEILCIHLARWVSGDRAKGVISVAIVGLIDPDLKSIPLAFAFEVPRGTVPGKVHLDPNATRVSATASQMPSPGKTSSKPADTAEPAQHKPNQRNASGKVSLPTDFAFLSLCSATRKVDLVGLIKDGELEQDAEGKEVRLYSSSPPDDVVQGLRGHGLEITIETKPGENRRFSLFWTPQAFSCYREGRLLGIWEPADQRFRTATSGEAENYIGKRYFFEIADQSPVGFIGPPMCAREHPRGSIRVHSYLGLSGEGVDEIEPKAGMTFLLITCGVSREQTVNVRRYEAVSQKGDRYTPLAVSYEGYVQFLATSYLHDEVRVSLGQDSRFWLEGGRVSRLMFGSSRGITFLYEVHQGFSLRELRCSNGVVRVRNHTQLGIATPPPVPDNNKEDQVRRTTTLPTTLGQMQSTELRTQVALKGPLGGAITLRPTRSGTLLLVHFAAEQANIGPFNASDYTVRDAGGRTYPVRAVSTDGGRSFTGITSFGSMRSTKGNARAVLLFDAPASATDILYRGMRYRLPQIEAGAGTAGERQDDR